MIKEYEFSVAEDNVGKRLDVVISDVTKVTRSAIKTNLKSILINGKIAKLSYKCRINELVKIVLEWPDIDILPEDIPLDIVYEDDNYIVINKKQGMVVHPAKGHYSGTLVNALMGMKKISLDADVRPGIVHRLDKDTSGLIVVTKNIEAHEYLSGLFRNRKVRKVYKAILKGRMMPLSIRVDTNIGRDQRSRKKMTVLKTGGKESLSIFRVMKHFDNITLAAINIKTGRTHQIRVHASSIGYPVLGDPVYSRKDKRYPESTLCLLSSRISFFDKFSNQLLDFKVKLPKHFKDVLLRDTIEKTV
ncbi:MAG: hypothetical protein A2015_06640 [Spirochaetes bacterium GWF1_31_7]|nr:MAG: hypothetical protein A2Y30_09820 [Spirochaetes bacterium GWE1_32_154]OHD46517.1 MAG: hypothetical protein A2015_06640 [Spirochaetes bacterium GWF1_31_7]OHD49326.1 MAG: hypothetical protein A2Y29_03635 [Spirochaetes bacterium GWE2_31_10]HBD96434.1 RluA family pseudouridine synthase [Spirochaetia bacterium]HBI36819.1 RluA family pseudouridine synthase [Spirochaetia bacterium]